MISVNFKVLTLAAVVGVMGIFNGVEASSTFDYEYKIRLSRKFRNQEKEKKLFPHFSPRPADPKPETQEEQDTLRVYYRDSKKSPQQSQELRDNTD